jgi:transcriptional regulator with XRE-family HTH domain
VDAATVPSGFAEFLREHRRQQRLSHAALGQLVGCTEQAVSLWERGLSKPQAAKLPRLAEALDVPLDELERLVGRRSKLRSTRAVVVPIRATSEVMLPDDDGPVAKLLSVKTHLRDTLLMRLTDQTRPLDDQALIEVARFIDGLSLDICRLEGERPTEAGE